MATKQKAPAATRTRNLVNIPGKWEEFDPERAKHALSLSTINRDIVEKDVMKYAMDMLDGVWDENNPEPVIFHEDGSLGNGHHRLLALIDANVTLRFFVHRNVPNKTKLVLDSGRSRSDADSLKISGYSSATTAGVGVLKRMMAGTKEYKKTSKHQVLAKYKEYEESILFASSGMPVKYRQAGLLAVIAKAREEGVPEERLLRFKNVFANNEDVLMEADADLQPAHMLKTLIQAGKIPKAGVVFYLIACKTLQCYLAGNRMKSVSTRQVEDDFSRWAKK